LALGLDLVQTIRHAEIEPKFQTVSPEDPVTYVLSLNLHRRQLTPSQLSMVAARVRTIYDEQRFSNWP